MTEQTVTADQAEGYLQRLPISVRLAMAWVKYSPRGRGWLSRKIGQQLPTNFRGAINTAAGARLAIDPGSLDVYCTIVRQQGSWEADVLAACLRYLKPNDVMYDVGANVGFMTIETARHLNGQVKAYAFEPQPTLARMVAVSAKINGFSDVHVFQVMVGCNEGEGTLFLPEHSVHASGRCDDPSARKIQVPVISIDQQRAAGILPPPRLIKIDVEGFERDVIAGAVRTLADHRPVIIFESNYRLTQVDYTRRQLCDLISAQADYRFFGLRGQTQIPMTDALYDDMTITDLIAEPV